MNRRIFLAGMAGAPLAAAPPFDFVLVLLGPPGAGKSTQAKRVAGKYHVKTISLAELLKKSSGAKLKNNPLAAGIETGEMLSTDEALLLIRRRLEKGDMRPGFVLDGFPHDLNQAKQLRAMLNELGYHAFKVVLLDVPDAVAQERMLRRKRAGDDEANAKRRLAEFRQNMEEVRAHLGERAFKVVDGTRTEAQVFKDVETAIGF
jgi:adenylate kinase